MAIPRASTALREKAVKMQLIDRDLRLMDQSGSIIAMHGQNLSKKEILQLKNKAVREFYLRPKYLLNRIVSCGSIKEMLEQVREGVFLLKKNI